MLTASNLIPMMMKVRICTSRCFCQSPFGAQRWNRIAQIETILSYRLLPQTAIFWGPLPSVSTYASLLLRLFLLLLLLPLPVPLRLPLLPLLLRLPPPPLLSLLPLLLPPPYPHSPYPCLVLRLLQLTVHLLRLLASTPAALAAAFTPPRQRQQQRRQQFLSH